MTIRELLLERYAPLHMLSDRTLELYRHTLDRFRDYLATVPGRVDPEPTLDDLDDLVVASSCGGVRSRPTGGRSRRETQF